MKITVVAEDKAAIESLERRMWARCLALGGSVSGEHGCGMGKVGALHAEWGEEALGLMWQLKKRLGEVQRGLFIIYCILRWKRGCS